MAILKIARMGHPILKRRAEPVAEPTDPEIRRLVADMIETMEDAPGVGLAAPQVHVPLRLVVLRPPRDDGDEDGEEPSDERDVGPVRVLINPEIEALDDEQTEGLEACLSVPGLAGMVPRYCRIRYRWTDLAGNRHELDAEDFHARVVQHECDHLDGILYPMRMTDLSTLSFTTEFERSRGEEA